MDVYCSFLSDYKFAKYDNKSCSIVNKFVSTLCVCVCSLCLIYSDIQDSNLVDKKLFL